MSDDEVNRPTAAFAETDRPASSGLGRPINESTERVLATFESGKAIKFAKWTDARQAQKTAIAWLQNNNLFEARRVRSKGSFVWVESRVGEEGRR